VGAAAIALAAAIAIALVLSRSLVGSAQLTPTAARHLAEGDLEQTITIHNDNEPVARVCSVHFTNRSNVIQYNHD
jgi:nitrogen fixation/metabolism regulation signal transduction histidine kinase